MSLLLLFLAACTVDTATPREVAYDHVACGHCGMMVSEPRYAAQLFEQDGTWKAFDDPACALHYIADHGPSLAGVWFHDGTTSAEHWIPWTQVGFVEADGPTPMDGGLSAVPVSTPGAVTVGVASTRLLDGSTK